MTQRLLDSGVEVVAQPATQTSLLVRLGVAVLPLVAIMAVFYIYTRRIRSGASAFARGRGVAAAMPDTRFSDIGGVDEVVAELAEVGDFLKHPERFEASGARAPRGFLLTGPPGTGKTMLARAVAGEAGVPFFAMSGSDFVETFAGVGAARVRRIFELARKEGQAIIFIDEIDAVGKSAAAGAAAATPTSESARSTNCWWRWTASPQSSVIVLAATNRPTCSTPRCSDPDGSTARSPCHPPTVADGPGSSSSSAGATTSGPTSTSWRSPVGRPGMTGADLAALMNEAALEATRSGVGVISAEHLESALATTVLGRERRSRGDQPARPQHQRLARGGAHRRARSSFPDARRSGSGDDRAPRRYGRHDVAGRRATTCSSPDPRPRPASSWPWVVGPERRSCSDGDFTSGPSQDFAGAGALATPDGDPVRHGSRAVSPTPAMRSATSRRHDAQAAVDQLLEDSMLAARALVAVVAAAARDDRRGAGR